VTPFLRARLAGAAIGLALGAHVLAGCAALGRRTVGSVPPAAAIAAIDEGASVGDVLGRLGAPLEYWLAPDGLLLVWREQRYEYDRLELDPSLGLSLVAIEPVIGTVLANLRLTLERGNLREKRVAVLFDRDGRVIAVAHRDGGGRRLR
jgi:hypothetical protein